MNTPIYDAMKAEQYHSIPAKPVEGWGNPAWITTTLTVTKPETAWKAFLCCLGWWKR